MKIKCVLFDFDGTLFDSMFIWDTVGDKYLYSIGKEPQPFTRKNIQTMSLYQSACYFKEEYDIPMSADEIIRGINQIVENFYFYEVQPKRGVLKFLNELKNEGISMCIDSATDKYLIEAALERCKIAGFFREIFTCSEVEHGKDRPYIFRTAMNFFEADRSNTIVFEDALYAAKTAKRDGFIVTAVYDKSEKCQNELKKICDCYLENFENTEPFKELILND